MQKKKPEVQDSILAGAFQIFQQRGYHGATMSDIAKVAGTTTSNIYNYFPSKDRFDLLPMRRFHRSQAHHACPGN